jgi:hypothetical protein
MGVTKEVKGMVGDAQQKLINNKILNKKKLGIITIY